MSETVYTLPIPKGLLRAHRGAYGGCFMDVGTIEVARGEMTFSQWYAADKDVPNAVAVDFYPRKGSKPLRLFTEDTPEKRQALIYILEQAVQKLKELQ